MNRMINMPKLVLDMRTWAGGSGNPMYLGFIGEGNASLEGKPIEIKGKFIQPIQLNIRYKLIDELNLPDNFKLTIEW